MPGAGYNLRLRPDDRAKLFINLLSTRTPVGVKRRSQLQRLRRKFWSKK
jgi:hypothetical protein